MHKDLGTRDLNKGQAEVHGITGAEHVYELRVSLGQGTGCSEKGPIGAGYRLEIIR